MSNAKPNRSDYEIPDRDRRTGGSAAASRIGHQHSWVDQQIRVSMAKGDFDDLPGAGKPIEGLGETHDPDWWLKQLVERERITGILPPSLQLRKDDAELDVGLDALVTEREARREIEDFNARVVAARYSLQQGPPLITMPRDVEETLTAWAQRRAARRATPPPPTDHVAPRRRWWHRKPRG